MTLKEELEVLRGEPIEVFTGTPMDIPCIETSDPEKLCKHPVVSVQMITYNHEPYIRQAIEGVMMQKTDFEFELIIGEDCSQDKTREICFEYQKKYPDKIRVLWWHENVSKLGGNGRRCRARCRGEFIAFCEGDDYWIDPQKLQKQVDVMRKYPSVGMVFCDAKVYWEMQGRWAEWDGGAYGRGKVPRVIGLLYQIYGKDVNDWSKDEMHILTATVMIRRTILIKMQEKFDIFQWKLKLGDKQLFIASACVSRLYYIHAKVSVYRRNNGGAMSRIGHEVIRDVLIVQQYFAKKGLGLQLRDAPRNFQSMILSRYLSAMCALSYFLRIKKTSHAVRTSMPKILSVSFFMFAVMAFHRGVFGLMAWRCLHMYLRSVDLLPARIKNLYCAA